MAANTAYRLLPHSFTTDPDRLARFQREAEVLAALNHPHIAHIHGLEESDGVRALVLELVEGPTLADSPPRAPSWYNVAPVRPYDVSRDNQGFLMIKNTGVIDSRATAQITVVVNWHEELKRLVPAK